jgi:5'-nucleotidase
MFLGNYPDVVVSGINHGSNAATASCYSGTLGAAAEEALNGIPAIRVSLDTLHPDADFSAVEKYFGDIFQKLMAELP